MADVSDFREEMVERINKIVAEREPKPTKLKQIKLKTATATPLKTEKDVDTYLASLKVELMQHINNNEEILIK